MCDALLPIEDLVLFPPALIALAEELDLVGQRIDRILLFGMELIEDICHWVCEGMRGK